MAGTEQLPRSLEEWERWAEGEQRDNVPPPPKPNGAGGDAVSMPAPLDIFSTIVTPVLDPLDFPAVLREFAAPVAAVAGHDPSGYLMAALAAAAGAVSDDLRLQLDPVSQWYESARLWVLLIGPPGSGKTPAIRAGMAPLVQLHSTLVKQYERDNPVGNGERNDDDKKKPPRPAVFTNDATIEKLSEVLVDNPRGVIAKFEELDTWLGQHDCYRGGQGSKDRGEWLCLFDGGPHAIDRIKRGSYFVPNWGVSILAATTPAGLQRHVRDLPADGLIQRFLPLVMRHATEPDEGMHERYDIERARRAFDDRLAELFRANCPAVVRLSPEAAKLFSERRRELRTEGEAMESVLPAMAGHVAKHATLLARVALTFHCLEHGQRAPEVMLSGQTLADARQLLHTLMRHSIALYGMLSHGDSNALELARSIARSILASGTAVAAITRADIAHICKAYRSAADHTRDSAMRLLGDASWLTPIRGRVYDGRPARYAVNAAVFDRFADEGEAHRQRRAAVRQAILGNATE